MPFDSVEKDTRCESLHASEVASCQRSCRESYRRGGSQERRCVFNTLELLSYGRRSESPDLLS